MATMQMTREKTKSRSVRSTQVQHDQFQATVARMQATISTFESTLLREEKEVLITINGLSFNNLRDQINNWYPKVNF